MQVNIADIKIGKYQRETLPWTVQEIAESIKDHGYNLAYPVVVDADNVLIDGGHRIEAARLCGLEAVPVVVKTNGASNIRLALQCNADRTKGREDDVFDLANLCWNLARDGWTGERIAQELGWDRTRVVQHQAIRAGLHTEAWRAARSVTNFEDTVTDDEGDVVTASVTRVTWTERHFRALLKHLAYTQGDRAIMRAQVAAVRDILARANEKDKRFGQTQKTVTAKWIDQLAARYAWQVKLAKHMRDTLVERVPLSDRKDLLKNVRRNVYGEKEGADNWAKFDLTCKRLNEKALGVILYHDDAFQRIPLLENGSVALVVTDPPYNVTDNPWDHIGTDDEYVDFTRRWLEALSPKLAPDYHLFFFCDPDYAARIEAEVLVPSGWPLLSRVIWWNRSLPSGRQPSEQFARTWQMLFHLGNHPLNWAPQWSDERFDVQEYAAPNRNTSDGGFHPTPKPQALIEHLVSLGSKPTDVVLDPFAGGGTTGAACAAIRQRRCLLIEMEDGFCANIERRLQIKREV